MKSFKSANFMAPENWAILSLSTRPAHRLCQYQEIVTDLYLVKPVLVSSESELCAGT